MELVGEILPVLVALYVVDSALLVRAGQALFVSGWGGIYEARGPGLRLPGLLPFAEAILGAPLPLRASAEGVLVPAGRGGERIVPFESMRAVRAEGGSVLLGGGHELPVSPRALAADVARVVDALRVTPRERRLARFRRELRARVDGKALAAVRARAARRLPALRLLSGLTFLAVFLLLPASLVPELPHRPSPLVASGVCALLYAATLGASVRLLRDCGVRRGRLLGALLPLLLFPPAAAHAPSIVARELYLGFEPLVLARHLLSPLAFERFRRRAGAPGADRDRTSEAWSVEALVRQLVDKSRHREDRAPAPPRIDPDATAFCPTCTTEYRAGFSRCSDCDQALVPFEDPVERPREPAPPRS